LSDSSQKKITQTQTPKRNQNDKSKSDRRRKKKQINNLTQSKRFGIAIQIG